MARRATLALLLCVIWCIVENRKQIAAKTLPSNQRQEAVELKNQLRKPGTVTTILTKHGDKYDCVDFYKQPAFDHPALKNHNFHPNMKSSSLYPETRTSLDHSLIVNQRPFKSNWANNKGCPLGTVPIKTTTKEDLIRVKLATEIYADSYKPLTAREAGTHYAVLRTNEGTKKSFNGAAMLATLWNPPVSGAQYSSSQLKIVNGLDSIEVGWTVNPSLYKDNRTRLYIYTRTAGSNCFNTYCPGFVLVRSDMSVDLPEPSSTRGGVIWDERFFLVRDIPSGNWWLKLTRDQTEIGFWPAQIFTGLTGMATYIEWGGKVYSPPDVPSPPMGAGEKLKKSIFFDAECCRLTTVNETFAMVDATETSTYSDIDEYRVSDRGFIDKTIRHEIFFGGKGGYIGN